MTMKLAKYLLIRAVIFLAVFNLPFIPLLWVEPLNDVSPVVLSNWADIYMKCLLVFIGAIWARTVSQICDWLVGEFPLNTEE
jgi:hypothetical protein